jgi:hypothetical protein
VIPSLSAILSVTYATYRMGKKFSAIEERFKIIDEKFNRIDEMFESLKLYMIQGLTKLMKDLTS